MLFSSHLFIFLYSFGKFSQILEDLGLCIKIMMSMLNMQTFSVALSMAM